MVDGKAKLWTTFTQTVLLLKMLTPTELINKVAVLEVVQLLESAATELSQLTARVLSNRLLVLNPFQSSLKLIKASSNHTLEVSLAHSAV
jgi:hypothetical protein